MFYNKSTSCLQTHFFPTDSLSTFFVYKITLLLKIFLLTQCERSLVSDILDLSRQSAATDQRSAEKLFIYLTKTLQDQKKVSPKHFIGSQGVKMLLPKKIFTIFLVNRFGSNLRF